MSAVKGGRILCWQPNYLKGKYIVRLRSNLWLTFITRLEAIEENIKSSMKSHPEPVDVHAVLGRLEDKIVHR